MRIPADDEEMKNEMKTKHVRVRHVVIKTTFFMMYSRYWNCILILKLSFTHKERNITRLTPNVCHQWTMSDEERDDVADCVIFFCFFFVLRVRSSFGLEEESTRKE